MARTISATSKYSALICAALLLAAVLSFSCGSEQTGLRSLAPADSIVYLESPDIGRLLETMEKTSGAAGSPSFDPSLLRGVEVAAAVTGFTATERALTDSESVLNFQPQFILIADTHAWSWQVRPLVEGSLGRFVTASYGAGTSLETSVKDGVEWYTWKSGDGREAFGAIKGSLVFFGNNRAGVERSLKVSSGEEDSLLSNERLSIQYAGAAGKLAFGFVTREGVRQLAEFAGVSTAIEQGDDVSSSGQGAISSVVSQLIGNSVEEIVWTSREESGEIEDVVTLRLDNDLAEVFVESMSPANAADEEIFNLIPGDAYSVTRYNLKNPRVAFRSLVLGAASKVDPPASRIVPAIGASLLESYGVDDPEGFLSVCEPFIVTVQFDEDGDKSAAIVRIPGAGKQLAEGDGLKISGSGSTASAREGDYLILGDPDSVKRCLSAKTRDAAAPEGTRLNAAPKFTFARRPENTAVTVRREDSSIGGLTGVLGDIDRSSSKFELTLTEFERSGVKRTYRSRLGFPGYFAALFSEGR